MYLPRTKWIYQSPFVSCENTATETESFIPAFITDKGAACFQFEFAALLVLNILYNGCQCCLSVGDTHHRFPSPLKKRRFITRPQEQGRLQNSVWATFFSKHFLLFWAHWLLCLELILSSARNSYLMDILRSLYWDSRHYKREILYGRINL